MPWKPVLRWLLLTAVAAGVLSCGGGVDLRMYKKVDESMASGDPESAAQEVVESGREAYGDENKLIYHLDLGYLLHVAGAFGKSAEQFQAADRLAADLYTESVSAEAASMFSNDMTIPYRGEEFEVILINLFNALNYAMQGDLESALVEIRRVDVKFKAFAKEGEGRYRVDPLVLYVSALMFEAAGEFDDAFISANRALDVYSGQADMFGVTAPEELRMDVARLARRAGRDVPEGADSRGETDLRPGHGEVVVLHYFGPGPRKFERIVEVSLGNGFAFVQSMDVRDEDQKDFQRTLSAAKGMASDTQVTVAFPVFEQPPLSCHGALVEAGNGEVGRAVVVENLSHVARVNLEDRMGRQWPRIVARAMVKFVTARAVGSAAGNLSGNSTVGFLAKIFTQAAMSASEAADVRCWRTLPGQILMSRVRVPAGSNEISVTHLGSGGEWTQVFHGVQVEDGGRTFLVTACY